MLADTIFGVLVAVLAIAALVIELLPRARRGAQTHARAWTRTTSSAGWARPGSPANERDFS